jgi:hypothetical protein
MHDIDELAARLASGRFRWSAAFPVDPGIYSLFLEDPRVLPTFALVAKEPIYIGMTADAAKKRNHFDQKDSGGSSPRRSLGALLKKQLNLHAVPRSDGDCTNYRFSAESEAALTAWMRHNLTMSHIPLDIDKARISLYEKQLIAKFKPPLNLSGFPANDARHQLKKLRELCREEARAYILDRGPDPGILISTAQLVDVIIILTNLVRSIYLKRALAKIEPKPRLNFWRVIFGNLLDMSVIEWCKLFGSDGEERQHVHWKNVFKNNHAFRTGLLSHSAVSREEWDDYWMHMKAYRDKFAAHFDCDRSSVSHYPQLELALTSTCYYYSAIVAELRTRGETRYPDNLEVYGERFYKQAVEIAADALAATGSHEERIY